GLQLGREVGIHQLAGIDRALLARVGGDAEIPAAAQRDDAEDNENHERARRHGKQTSGATADGPSGAAGRGLRGAAGKGLSGAMKNGLSGAVKSGVMPGPSRGAAAAPRPARLPGSSVPPAPARS